MAGFWKQQAVCLVILVAHLCGILADNLISQDSWVQISNPVNPISARDSHSAVFNTVNKTMVIFGGRDTKKSYNDITTYTLDTDEWDTDATTTGTPPIPRYGHSAVVDGLNRMIIFGGRNSSMIFNDVIFFDLLHNTWYSNATSGARPTSRAFHTAVVDTYQHVMYVYGGSNDVDIFSDVYALDLDALVWSVIVPTNGSAAQRSSHTAVLSGTGIMVVYGGLGSSDTPRGDVACFSTRTHAWSSCLTASSPAPGQRYAHTAVISPLENMVIFGGLNSAGNAQSDIWNFDLNKFKWYSVVPGGLSIDGRSYHSSVATSLGSMLVVGGINSDGVVNNDFGLYSMAATVVRTANDGAVLVVLVTLMSTILIALCFAMDYMNEQSELEKEEAIEKAKQEALLRPKLPPIPKALHIPIGPRAQKFFEEFRTSLDPLADPPK